MRNAAGFPADVLLAFCIIYCSVVKENMALLTRLYRCFFFNSTAVFGVDSTRARSKRSCCWTILCHRVRYRPPPWCWTWKARCWAPSTLARMGRCFTFVSLCKGDKGAVLGCLLERKNCSEKQRVFHLYRLAHSLEFFCVVFL